MEGTKHEVDLYCDIFFTLYALMKFLADQNIKATGIVRGNRTNGAAKLMKQNAVLKKRKKGEFEFFIFCDGEVFAHIWNGNSIVTIASNHETYFFLQEAPRCVMNTPKTKVQ